MFLRNHSLEPAQTCDRLNVNKANDIGKSYKATTQSNPIKLWLFTVQHKLVHAVKHISHAVVCKIIVNNPDVIGASPVGAVSTTSSLSTKHLASIYWEKTITWRDEKNLSFGIWCGLYQMSGGILFGRPHTWKQKQSFLAVAFHLQVTRHDWLWQLYC